MAKGKKIPMRKCVGCQEMKEKIRLLRIVRTEDGHVRTDVTGRVNGRGAYLCFDRSCLEKAMRSRALQRSLGIALSPEDLREIEQDVDKEIKVFETG